MIKTLITFFILTLCFKGHGASKTCASVFSTPLAKINWVGKAKKFEEPLNENPLFQKVIKQKSDLEAYEGELFKFHDKGMVASIWSLMQYNLRGIGHNFFSRILEINHGDYLFVLNNSNEIIFSRRLQIESLPFESEAFSKAIEDYGYPIYKRTKNVNSSQWTKFFSEEAPYTAVIVRKI